MQLNLKARDWHNWISVILVLPMLLVGFTSFFLAHKKSLGLNDIDLTPYVAWLPGYGAGAVQAQHLELRTAITLADGRRYIGTNTGLFEITTAGPLLVDALSGMQVRDLTAVTGGVLAATKDGLWLERDGRWQRVLKGDAWNVNAAADGSLTAALKDRGLVTSRDGVTWHSESGAAGIAALRQLPADELPYERVTLGKLIIDMHTGKAFLGKDKEWLWIDLLAFVWVFLGFTGLWLWWRAQARRHEAALKRVQAVRSHA